MSLIVLVGPSRLIVIGNEKELVGLLTPVGNENCSVPKVGGVYV